MKNKWFLSYHFIFPALILLVIIGAQLWPYSGLFYKVKQQTAKITQIHPETVTVQYFNIDYKTGKGKLYSVFVDGKLRAINNYKEGDQITVYHMANRPEKAFFNRNSPPQSRSIAFYGFFLLIIWVWFYIRRLKRNIFDIITSTVIKPTSNKP